MIEVKQEGTEEAKHSAHPAQASVAIKSLGNQQFLKVEQVIKQLEQDASCERISRTKNQVLLKPKPLKDIGAAKLITLNKLVESVGGTYSPTAGTFTIPMQFIPVPPSPVTTTLEMAQEVGEQFAELLLTDLVTGPQPRTTVDNLSLGVLMTDMQANGMKQRIVVRPSPHLKGKYEVLDGNRRKRVAESLHWLTVKVIVRNLSDVEAYEYAFTANNNRKELSDLEVGRWLYILKEKFPDRYPTQEMLAKCAGLKQPTVSRLLNFYVERTPGLVLIKKLPGRPRKALMSGDISSPELTEYRDRLIRSALPELQSLLLRFDSKMPRPTFHQLEKFKDNLELIPDAAKMTLEEVMQAIAARPELADSDSAEETETEPNPASKVDSENPDLPPLPSEAVEAEVKLGSTQEIRRKLHMAAAKESMKAEAVQKLRLYLEPSKKTVEQALKEQQEEYAAQQKAEEIKRRSLVNSLKEWYSEEVTAPVVAHFGRQSDQKTSRAAYLFAEFAVRKIAQLGLVGEVLEEVDKEIS